MAWKRNILVVANLTAASDELLGVLCERAARGPISCTFVVPSHPLGGGRAAAADKLAEALDQLRAAGVEADGAVGDSDPVVAVISAWDPRRYDEIIIATLPMRVSKWLHAGLPERIERITGCSVTHVIAQPPKPPVVVSPPRAHDDTRSGPLSVLGWGAASVLRWGAARDRQPLR